MRGKGRSLDLSNNRKMALPKNKVSYKEDQSVFQAMTYVGQYIEKHYCTLLNKNNHGYTYRIEHAKKLLHEDIIRNKSAGKREKYKSTMSEGICPDGGVLFIIINPLLHSGYKNTLF